MGNGGYIGITVALIVTLITMAIALTFSSANFLGRFDTQVLELKSLSRGVAEGCLEYARLKISLGAYNGNETISISGYNCDILPIESSPTTRIIKSRATIQDKTTNLKLTINYPNLTNVSMEEY